MLRVMLSLAVVLAASIASAAEPMRVYKLDAGYYAVQGTGIVRVQIVTPDDPTPQPDPTPDVLSANSKAIRDAAQKATSDPNRETTALQLAELYRLIAGKVTDKAIVGQEMIAFAVKYGTDQLLTGKGSAVSGAWKPTRDVFSTQWADVLNKGGSDADYAKLLTDAAAGLQASAPNAEPQIDMQMILAIIKLVMELIALFS